MKAETADQWRTVPRAPHDHKHRFCIMNDYPEKAEWFAWMEKLA